MRRDWKAVAASKLSYWGDRFREDGWRPAWDASDALLLEMRRAQPAFPTEHDRDMDFKAHLRLRNLLDRGRHAIAGR